MKLNFFRYSILTVFFFLISDFLIAQGATEKPANAIQIKKEAPVSNTSVLAHTGMPVQSVAWRPDGKYFATTWNNSVILWDADLNTITAIWSGHKDSVVSGKFSSDGQWFLSVSEDNSLIIRNIDEKISAIKIVGEGAYPIRDAVFMDNGYSVMAPIDGLNTTHCFRLVMTNQFIFKGIVSTVSPVKALDVNPELSRLLLTTADGTVTLYNLDDSIDPEHRKQSFPRYVDSNIGAIFSPDGQYFLSAADKTSLVVCPVYGQGASVIRDSDMPVNAAVFSPDGSKVAAALRNGMIKVYEISSGTVTDAYSILVEAGDVVESLAFSPDGNSLVAGTKLGYIFRWGTSEIARREIVPPVRKTYETKDLDKLAEVLADKTVVRNVKTNEEKVASEISKKTVSLPRNTLSFSLTYNTLGSEQYVGAFDLTGIYRNLKFYPIHFGGGGDLSAGMPSSKFKYSYSVGNKPWLYSAAVYGLIGLSYYNPKADLLLFSELHVGGNLRLFFNNDFTYYNVSKPSGALQLDVIMGIQWNHFHVIAGGTFDSNLGMLLKAGLGFTIYMGTKDQQKEIPSF